jgi:hypothetical protein
MAILEGDEARRFSEELRHQQAERDTKILEERKSEAKNIGKEMFDLEALKALVDTRGYTKIMDDVEKERKQLEYEYYVSCVASPKTINEFADFIIRMYNSYVE